MGFFICLPCRFMTARAYPLAFMAFMAFTVKVFLCRFLRLVCTCIWIGMPRSGLYDAAFMTARAYPSAFTVKVFLCRFLRRVFCTCVWIGMPVRVFTMPILWRLFCRPFGHRPDFLVRQLVCFFFMARRACQSNAAMHSTLRYDNILS